MPKMELVTYKNLILFAHLIKSIEELFNKDHFAEYMLSNSWRNISVNRAKINVNGIFRQLRNLQNLIFSYDSASNKLY